MGHHNLCRAINILCSPVLPWHGVSNVRIFMKGINWVDDLKLRIGAGTTGNSAVDSYTTKGAITSLFYPFVSTVVAGSLPSSIYANQELGWEKTTQYNFGLDFSL